MTGLAFIVEGDLEVRALASRLFRQGIFILSGFLTASSRVCSRSPAPAKIIGELMLPRVIVEGLFSLEAFKHVARRCGEVSG